MTIARKTELDLMLVSGDALRVEAAESFSREDAVFPLILLSPLAICIIDAPGLSQLIRQGERFELHSMYVSKVILRLTGY